MTKFQCILSTVDFQVLLILEENLEESFRLAGQLDVTRKADVEIKQCKIYHFKFAFY